jgi:hypothetical protein
MVSISRKILLSFALHTFKALIVKDRRLGEDGADSEYINSDFHWAGHEIQFE